MAVPRALRYPLLAVLPVLLAAPVLASVERPARAALQGERSEVVIGLLGEPATINGVLARRSPERDIARRIYLSLLGADPDTGADQLAAEPVSVSEDGLEYTIVLRPDARWHDGEPVRAADVELSLEAARELGVVDADWTDVAAVDERTVQITLPQPDAYLIDDVIAPLAILPAHLWGDRDAETWATDPGSTGAEPGRAVGSGPFAFEEWLPGGHLSVVRDDDYWAGEPARTERIIWRFFRDCQTLKLALISGEIAGFVAPAGCETTELTEAGFTVSAVDTLVSTNLWFNLDAARASPVADQRVRQALFSAIDRQALVDARLGGQAAIVPGTQSPLSFAFAPDRVEQRYDYDPARAAALLDEAGWVDGDGDGVRDNAGRRLELTLVVLPGFDEGLAAMLVAMWREIGVEARYEIVDGSALLGDRAFDVFLGRATWSPTGDQASAFGSGRFGNLAGYANPEFDELSEQARRTLDPEQRRELLIAASAILVRDLPAAFLWYDRQIVAYDPRLQGFEPQPLDVFAGLARVWLEEG